MRLLDHSGLVRVSQNNQEMTAEGFKHVLMPPLAQAHNVLLSYMQLQRTDILTPLRVIFNFTLCQPNKAYCLKEHDEQQRLVVEQLHDFGLLYYR